MRKPTSWQSTIGDFVFGGDRVVFRGGLITDPQTSNTVLKVGVALCDLPFNGGQIEMRLSYNNATVVPTAHVVLYKNALDGTLVTAGLDGGTVEHPKLGRFCIQTWDNTRSANKFQTLNSTSFVERELSGELRLRVKQTGSLIDLFADEVLVVRHIISGAMPRSQCGVYLVAANETIVSDYIVNSKRRTAFVVMQFTPPYDQLFSEVIKPVATSTGFDAERADDTAGPGLIIADIIRQIIAADVVVADITPENQNVFYEVGYAHALGKPVILLAEKGKKLPFDVSGMRVLFYEDTIAGKAQVEEGLRRHFAAIVDDQPPTTQS